MKMRMIIGCVFALGLSAPALGGESIYRSPDSFVAEAFHGDVQQPRATAPPAASVLWLRQDLRARVADVLGRQPGMRVRYWQAGNRTAWILEDIGKDKPITAGFVVQDGAIASVEVLVFRESRGWEVKHPFFTRQFRDARLSDGGYLDQQVDGITGATLSVRAMTRMARVALLLDEHVRNQSTTLAKAGGSSAD